jgi:hypothetical protein
MDLKQYVSELQGMSDDQVEKISQDCSKQIVFNMLDGKPSPGKEYITDCGVILAEYRKRLFGKIESEVKQPLQSEESK